ncbi:hypothetical protein [Dyadobacter sp. CY261]|uniref:hypothetical protein n=1 Tax=Dyadobacter sp. CY261 TaxID=2907203 RepID=UPI001F32F0F2|nr:hypothetical protein [Dyadobacter sp. CY261]
MLCYLFSEVTNLKDEIVKTFIHVSLLSLLKNSSSQDRGWGCIADNMLPKKEQLKEKNVFRNLLSKVNQIAGDIELSVKDIRRQALTRDDISKLAANSDVRHAEIDKKSIDCIITSPPYPNMTDYITSQRLNYYYLNADPDKEKFNETGARFKRNRLDSNERYKIEMMSINHHLYDLMKPNGYLCLILPEFGIEIQRDQNRKKIIADIIENLEDIGFVKRDIFERILPSMRRSHNQKWASLEKEKIYIYQKSKL